MKTTIDIHSELLVRAKRYARDNRRSLRSVVEEGLRRVLSASPTASRYRMPDLSHGDPCDDDPLAAYTWQDLSEMIYEPERIYEQPDAP
ncbi:hypothetical protein [Candidatus Palauibacter sp.]|uniref:hypothetical protein n=1 Tax=Candidatus Palauibacter sp. TaxID=3101350 RepID=UPI003AF2A5D1